VATLLRTVFEQPDADAVKAQMTHALNALEAKFPKTAAHLDTAQHDLLAFTAFLRYMGLDLPAKAHLHSIGSETDETVLPTELTAQPQNKIAEWPSTQGEVVGPRRRCCGHPGDRPGNDGCGQQPVEGSAVQLVRIEVMRMAPVSMP
jgi:hypothetical protein